jgi:ParB-like chromosome segregation protein Spo0J
MATVTPDVGDDQLRRDARVEALIETWGFKFTYEPAFPLKNIKRREEIQVRESIHRAPKERVEEYAVQMKAGALFPPILLSHNHELFDGNTRKAAAESAGYEDFPAYVVALPGPQWGRMLGAAINQTGAARLSPDEAFTVANEMFDENFSDEQIAKAIGRRREQVLHYRREKEFDQHATEAGVSSAPVTRAVKRELAKITHSEPFKAAVDAAATTKASAPEVRKLAAELATTRSDDEALEKVEAFREQHKASGPPPHRKTAEHKEAKAALKAVKNLLGKITDPPAKLAPPALRADAEPEWTALRDLAASVVQAFAEQPPVEHKEAA